MCTFETEMKQYAKDWWVVKGEDGIWQMVNHSAYLKYKKGIENNKAITTITPYSVDGSLYILMMINGSLRKMTSLVTALGDVVIDKMLCEEGGTIIFHKDNIEHVVKEAKMKKKSKVEMTEEQKEALRERFLAVRAQKSC